MSESKHYGIIANLAWSISKLLDFNVTYLALLIVESVLKGITPVVALLFTQKILNDIQSKTGAIENVVYMMIILTLFEMFSDVSIYYLKVKLRNYEVEFETFIQVTILNKISSLSCKEFEDSNTYDLIARTQYDLDASILGNIKTLFLLVATAISCVSYSIIVIKYNVILFFVILLVPVIRYYFEKKYNILEYEVIKENTERERKAQYLLQLLTNSENFKEIKLFNLFNYFIDKYNDIKSICNLKQIKLNNRRMRSKNVLNLIEAIIDFFVIINIVVDTFVGRLLIGEFILYNSSLNNIKQNMIIIFSQMSLIYKNSLIVEQIRNFFELPIEDLRKDGIKVEEIQEVKLENVSYCYQNSDVYTLKNISFCIRKDDSLVLMGYNGSGKSTLLKVIMGIYHDYDGCIYINGINLKKLDMENYRSKIGGLFQDYIKYESSIAENIAFGNLKYIDDLKQIKKVLKKVKLESFVNQVDKKLGYQFNDGRQISIGEWQKLALARVLSKECDVYVFDEPNSSLDLVSESAILNLISHETKGKISITIMHRFNQKVISSSRIMVLSNGQIEEMGNHNELIENKGLYYELFSTQVN